MLLLSALQLGHEQGFPFQRGHSIISCLGAGEIPPLLIYSHPRNAVFCHHSHVAETGRVLPASDRDRFWCCHPSASLFALSRGKCSWVGGRGNNTGDTLPAGAHGNLLDHPEKDPNASPCWVPGAAPRKALVWLMGKGVRCLPAGCAGGQAGAEADAGTEPPWEERLEAWETLGKWVCACSVFGFPKPEPCRRKKWLEPMLLGFFEKGNPIWAKSKENPAEIQMFLMYQQSFWVPASVGRRPNSISMESQDCLCNPTLALFPA